MRRTDGAGEEEVAEGRSRRWQATNWLAPLPPGPVVKDVAVRVSPAWGRRGVVVMRSVFREPITRMDMLRGVRVGVWWGKEGEALLGWERGAGR